MNYIVNPAIFYWMSVANGLLVFLGVLTAVFIVLSIIFIVDYHVQMDSGYEKDAERPKRWLKVTVPLVIIFGLAAVFIPSKNTILEMMIAKMATYENAFWTMETLKEAVDYIVEALAKLK